MFANVLSEIQACRKFLLARRRGLTIWVIVFTYSRSGYIKIHKFNFTKYFNSGNNIIIFFSAMIVRVKLLLVWLLLVILHDKNRGDVIFTKNLKALLICCVNYVMTSGFCVHKYSTFVATGSIKRPLIYILT